MTHTVYVNTDRTVMVRQWENGIVEVATRKNTAEVWGPPVHVAEEKKEPCSAAAYSTETQAGIAIDTFQRRYADARFRIERCGNCGMYHLEAAA